MTKIRNLRAAKIGAATLAFALVAGCGGSDDADTDDGQDPAPEQTVEAETDASSESDGESTAEEPDNDESADDAGQGGDAGSISWTAPDGLDAATIAVSPGGDQVAVGFQSASAFNAEVVVFDTATGDEAWRGAIEDAGDFGLGGLMFTTAGVSFYLNTLDGSQIVTFTDGNTSMTDADFECAQFLNGTIDPTANVAYTVVPGGFCRVDLSTSATVAVTADEVLAGAVGSNSSIAFGADGSLVATVTNADGAPEAIIVDPATLAAIGPAGDVPVPLDREYRDLLIEGPSLSSGDRIAASPDRTTIVLLQPDTLEVLG